MLITRVKTNRKALWKSAPFFTSVLLLFGVIFFVIGYGKEQKFIKFFAERVKGYFYRKNSQIFRY